MHIFACVYIQCICLKKPLQFMIAVILYKCSLLFQEDLKPRRTFRWFRGDIYFSQLLSVGILWAEVQGTKAPSFFLMLGRMLQQTLPCIVGEKLLFKFPSLFSLRTLLIKWQNCCSIAVLSPWPCVSVLRQYCDITSCDKSLPCNVLGTDRGLCIYPGKIIYIIWVQV